LDKVQGAHVKI